MKNRIIIAVMLASISGIAVCYALSTGPSDSSATQPPNPPQASDTNAAYTPGTESSAPSGMGATTDSGSAGGGSDLYANSTNNETNSTDNSSM